MKNTFPSIEYLKWVRQANLPPLTNSQARMAEFLLSDPEVVGKVGDLETIFKSIQKYLKNERTN